MIMQRNFHFRWHRAWGWDLGKREDEMGREIGWGEMLRRPTRLWWCVWIRLDDLLGAIGNTREFYWRWVREVIKRRSLRV